MSIIDSDTHVIESELTWEFLDDLDLSYRPELVKNAEGASYWVIDGQQVRVVDNEQTGAPVDSQELRDIDLRLRHMDELGADIHVIYPTLLIGLFGSARREVHLALIKSYNRWMADIWKRGKGRLRWVVVPPLMDMDVTISELRFAKDHGACGVLMHGIVTDDRPATSPYLFPLYEGASRLNMPICFHTGSGSPTLGRMFPRLLDQKQSSINSFWSSRAPMLAAFHGLIRSNIPAKFPMLRWGFLEAGASWVPYMLSDLGAFAYMFESNMQSTRPQMLESTLLRDNRFYVACEIQDDLPYILEHVGDANIVYGSDYGHADPASVLQGVSMLRERAETGKVSSQSINKILDDNARALYGL